MRSPFFSPCLSCVGDDWALRLKTEGSGTPFRSSMLRIGIEGGELRAMRARGSLGSQSSSSISTMLLTGEKGDDLGGGKTGLDSEACVDDRGCPLCPVCCSSMAIISFLSSSMALSKEPGMVGYPCRTLPLSFRAESSRVSRQ